MDFFASTDNWPILTILIFLPLVGALLLPLFGRGQGRMIWALAVTLAEAACPCRLYRGSTRRRPTTSSGKCVVDPSLTSTIPWVSTASACCWC